MKIKMTGERVLVKPLESEEKTTGGIVLPDTAKEKPQTGKVLEVGPGRVMEDGTRGTMEVKRGNTILYGKYAGTEIKIDGQPRLILRESEILAVVE